MVRHYLAIAGRNLRRSPFTSAVNVLTLAAGLACFLTAAACVAFWNRAESSFPNAARAHVLSTSFTFFGGNFSRSGVIEGPSHAAELLRADFPALERVARAFVIERELAAAAGERSVRLFAVGVDPEFLDIFDLPFAAGEPRAALERPSSVVLTADAAGRLFGTADPLGRSVLLGNAVEATVTGVVNAVPEPSHLGRSSSALLPFDLLASVDVYEALRPPTFAPQLESERQFFGGPAITYLLLPADGSLTASELEGQLADFAARHIPAETLESSQMTLGLIPVTHLLRNNVDAEMFSADVGMSVTTALLVLGTLVLGVACVNYANLATARGVRRAREVGVRKALGASPAQIMLQHSLEAALLCLAALIVAVAAVVLALPVLERALGAELGAVLVPDPRTWAMLAGVIVAVALAAGAYPAFVLARVSPAGALRTQSARLGPRRLTTVVVGAQFAAAAFLLITVLVTAAQNAQLVALGLGHGSNQLVLIENDGRTSKVSADTLRTELAALPQVRGVSEMAGLPWQRLVAVTVLHPTLDAASTGRRTLVRTVGQDFFDVFDIPVLAGRVFEAARDAAPAPAGPPAGTSGGSAPPQPPVEPMPIVVDTAFVEAFGFASPEAAVDSLVYYPPQPGGAGRAVRILGVVDTRRFAFRGAGASATMYTFGSGNVAVARVAPADIGAALQAIDATWRRLAPNVAISRYFFDELFGRAYATFSRLNTMFTVLALAAFVISMAGLFGIATLAVGCRLREIAVRKTFGARTGRLVMMLLGSFWAPVIVANLIAWPLALTAARAYLAAFVEPVEITLTPFVIAFAVTLAAASIAVIGQTLAAARAAPAAVLRSE